MSLRNNILLIRQLTGSTQTEFGALFNATKAMIVSYEKGKALPSELMVDRLSEKLGIEKYSLLQEDIREKDIKVEKLESLKQEIRNLKVQINHKLSNPLIVMNEGDIENIYYNRLLKEKERVIEEKEARRLDAEGRLKKEEERVDTLIANIQTALHVLNAHSIDIIEAHKVAAGFQHFWIDKLAEQESKGDPVKAEKLAKAYRKAVAEKYGGKKVKSTP